jgi:hypothetical protein
VVRQLMIQIASARDVVRAERAAEREARREAGGGRRFDS